MLVVKWNGVSAGIEGKDIIFDDILHTNEYE